MSSTLPKALYGICSTESAEGDAPAQLTMLTDMGKDEYEAEIAGLEPIGKISGIAGLYTALDRRHSRVTTLLSLDPTRAGWYEEMLSGLQDAVEDYIREVRNFNTRMEAELRKIDPAYVDRYKAELSAIYDGGESYPLIYKLRNYVEHQARLPLRLHAGIDSASGEGRCVLTLDSATLLAADSAHPSLNKKVKGYLQDNPEVDLGACMDNVHAALANLAERVMREWLITSDIAEAAMHYLRYYSTLKPAADTLSISEWTGDSAASDFRASTKSFSRHRLCNILSYYLNARPGYSYVLFLGSQALDGGVLLPGRMVRGAGTLLRPGETIRLGPLPYVVLNRTDCITPEPGYCYCILREKSEAKEVDMDEVRFLSRCYGELLKVAIVQ